MCASSVIYDMFAKLPDSWYTLERVDLFRHMIADARTFDAQTGQPDCEDADKAKLEDHIQELENELKNDTAED